MTFSGRFVLSMIQYAVANGADFESLMAMTGHDFNLLRTLVKFAEEKVEELDREVGFFHQTRKYVMNMMTPDFPTIDAVAANMNTSVRTLQRRLKDEGVTFKDVIESLRKELAFSYMKQEKLSIKEIADLLSYADTSAFSRSFKKWTGQTPSAYREMV